MKYLEKNSGFSFIVILIALAIAGSLYFFIVKNYIENPSKAQEGVKKELTEQGINTSDLPSTIKKAKNATEEAQKLNKNLEKQLQELK